jgi:pimeloyl-ACP methyl ester carboxylesterase
MIDHNGCRLSFTTRGEGERVLFIQGTGLHGEGWRPQVDGLADEYCCLTFDNRGMGLSLPEGGRITIEGMAEDALAILDAAGWESAHVVGHSLGGLVAQAMALRARERVRSLSLLCTFPRGRDATALTGKMIWLGLRTMIGTRRMRRLAFLNMVISPDGRTVEARDAFARSLMPLFGHDLADHPPVVRRQLAAMNACDLTPRLGELAGIPTLVLTAAHDLIAKLSPGKALAAGIPGARYVEIPDAAHGVTIQQADRVNSLLRGHFCAADVRIDHSDGL